MHSGALSGVDIICGKCSRAIRCHGLVTLDMIFTPAAAWPQACAIREHGSLGGAWGPPRSDAELAAATRMQHHAIPPLTPTTKQKTL